MKIKVCTNCGHERATETERCPECDCITYYNGEKQRIGPRTVTSHDGTEYTIWIPVD